MVNKKASQILTGFLDHGLPHIPGASLLPQDFYNQPKYFHMKESTLKNTYFSAIGTLFRN